MIGGIVLKKSLILAVIIVFSAILCPQAMAAPKMGLTASIGAVAVNGTALTPSIETSYTLSDHFALFARLDFAILTLGPRFYFTAGRLRPFIEASAGTPVTGFEFFVMGGAGIEWEFVQDAILSCQAGAYGRFVAGGIVDPFGAFFVGYRL